MMLLSALDVASELARSKKQWVIYLAPSPVPDGEQAAGAVKAIQAAVPCLAGDAGGGIAMDGLGYVVCQTEEEAVETFQRITSDDGPDGERPGAYACVFDPEGDAVTENT